MLIGVYLFFIFFLLGVLGYIRSSVFKGLYRHYKWVLVGFSVIRWRDKSASYECGFVDINSATNTYTLQFFVIRLSFMLFDLEILLIIPMLVLGLELRHLVFANLRVVIAVSVAAYYEIFGGVVDFF